MKLQMLVLKPALDVNQRPFHALRDIVWTSLHPPATRPQTSSCADTRPHRPHSKENHWPQTLIQHIKNTIPPKSGKLSGMVMQCLMAVGRTVGLTSRPTPFAPPAEGYKPLLQETNPPLFI